MTLGIHRRPFEGLYIVLNCCSLYPTCGVAGVLDPHPQLLHARIGEGTTPARPQAGQGGSRKEGPVLPPAVGRRSGPGVQERNGPHADGSGGDCTFRICRLVTKCYCIKINKRPKTQKIKGEKK